MCSLWGAVVSAKSAMEKKSMLSKATRAANPLLTVNPAISAEKVRADLRGPEVRSTLIRFGSPARTRSVNDSYAPTGRVRTLSETGRLEPVVERFEMLFLAERRSIPGELRLRPVLADFLAQSPFSF